MTKVGVIQQKSDETCGSRKGTACGWGFWAWFFFKNVLKLQFDVAGRALYFEDYELWSYEGQDLSRFFSGKMHPLQASCCHFLTLRSCWTICWWPNLTSRTVNTLHCCHFLPLDIRWCLANVVANLGCWFQRPATTKIYKQNTHNFIHIYIYLRKYKHISLEDIQSASTATRKNCVAKSAWQWRNSLPIVVGR